MNDDFRQAALAYHCEPQPGKLAIKPTKSLSSQQDLALAYSPGVAAACEAIVADPASARDLTARGNLVAVITNGTAVLGLGNIGPLAAKPVMEGKVVLVKLFAGIDAFDLEIDQPDPDRFVETVASLEPTFGGINLEDIKAPECFEIEAALRTHTNIPVFHDDQHGTAIVCAAAVINALALRGKSLAEVRLVTSGAGAAALACVDLLVSMGLPADHVTMTDIDGVVHAGRSSAMAPNMRRYARATDARSLALAADVAAALFQARAGGPARRCRRGSPCRCRSCPHRVNWGGAGAHRTTGRGAAARRSFFQRSRGRTCYRRCANGQAVTADPDRHSTIHNALIEACTQRTRPIIMTSMAMIAGMLPTALAFGEGSESRQPMAIAVAGGMFTSTLLSLILVPVIYEIIDGFEMKILPRFARLITPRQPGDDLILPEQAR